MPIKIRLDTEVCCTENGRPNCPRINDCPNNAIYWSGEKLEIDYSKCDSCGSCFQAIGNPDYTCASIVLEVDGEEFRYAKSESCGIK